LNEVLLCLPASRRDLGLPDDWSIVLNWIHHNQASQIEDPEPLPPTKVFVKKFPAIPTLTEYGKSTTPTFWENFPSKSIPLKPETRIKVQVLKDIIEEMKPSLLKSELKRAQKCVDFLENGGPSFQSTKLKGCNVKNSKAAIKYG
jgi:hypothetical protein